MKPTVAHFLRKYSQLKASFIKNQIEYHKNFEPVVLYKVHAHKRAGGFADFSNNDLPLLKVSEKDSFLAGIKLKLQMLVSQRDVASIQKHLKQHNVEVLHFHYGTDAGIYLPFLKVNKIPSVVSFYGYDSSGFPGYFAGYGKRYLNKRVFPYVTKVIAMSPDMEKDLVKIGCPSDKIIVHHHGNDVKRFYHERVYSVEKERINFLIISGLTPQKGHLFLLESFKNALNRIKNIRLTIVGDGILRKKISEYIKKNNLSASVCFERSVVYNSQQHLDYLNNCDVFIHPSVTDVNGDKEGIPGAIIEAMASGLPIISTKHAGIPYIIENRKTGLLVDEFDVEALTNAIIELATDEELRKQLGLAGQHYALEHLDLEKKEDELEKIYREII